MNSILTYVNGLYGFVFILRFSRLDDHSKLFTVQLYIRPFKHNARRKAEFPSLETPGDSLNPCRLVPVYRRRVPFSPMTQTGRTAWKHTTRGVKSTEILYSSKSTFTLMKFYLSTSKSTHLKSTQVKAKK